MLNDQNKEYRKRVKNLKRKLLGFCGEERNINGTELTTALRNIKFSDLGGLQLPVNVGGYYSYAYTKTKKLRITLIGQNRGIEYYKISLDKTFFYPG